MPRIKQVKIGKFGFSPHFSHLINVLLFFNNFRQNQSIQTGGLLVTWYH